MDAVSFQTLQAALGHTFDDPDVLALAMRHASVADDRVESNERLEFLGDSVLGLIVARRLYDMYPELLEGEMTKIRSAVVSRQTCAKLAKRLELDEHLNLGKGMRTHDRVPQSLAAGVFESVLGALYLDGGMETAERFLLPLVDPLIRRAAASGHQENYKSVLQQHALSVTDEPPTYRILDEKGPDHAKAFKACVEIAGRRYEPCWGQSKKQAEQGAALNALLELGLLVEDDDGVYRVVESQSSDAET